MATKVFRFALGSPTNPLSGLWRLWTQEDEVHMVARTMSEAIAFTAYPTGRWRIAVGTAISRWTRPKQFRTGWTRGPDLVIPHSAVPLRSPGNDPFAKEPVSWLPPPAPSYLARFTLLFASPRAEEGRWRPPDAPDTQSIMVLPLRTAGALHICRVDEPMGPEERARLVVPDATSGHEPGLQSMRLDVIVSADAAGRPSLWESHAP